MNQGKIGMFIAECRKKQNLTQLQLSKKLNITDRAISKWENGKGMPDVSIMLELCKELNISVNELLSGEEIKMEDYKQKTEDLLLEMAEHDEMQNKKLLAAMWSLGIISTIFYLMIIALAVTLIGEEPIRLIVVLIATVVFIITCCICVKFEVEAGYYECQKCHHRFKATYKDVMLACHAGTIRYLKCPECNKRGWDRKVMHK